MFEAIIAARSTAQDLVESKIDELELRNNAIGQHDHDTIMTYKKGLEIILGSQWNSLTPRRRCYPLARKRSQYSCQDQG